MRAVDIISRKRSGAELSAEEIRFMVRGCVTGEVPDYQISAFLMAIFFRGMLPRETATLTEAMLASGERMDLSGIPGPFVDKHSTGGVGDKISLPLAPLVAACGAKVPMMSGRALGHTGGTLDKLESIPGYRTGLDQAAFRAGLMADGFAMTGQTASVVPADKKLYALRDVTATVESIPLITASILSKKVAEGAESLVFDVKCGSGAFMKSREDARALAASLVSTGEAMGKRIVALITDMSAPLGRKVGNFLEIEETLDCLEGSGPEDVMELVLRQGAWMLVVSGLAQELDQGLEICSKALASGRARDLFLANVARQGGDVRRMLDLRGTYRSPHSALLKAPSSGWIGTMDAYAIGLAGVSLGVGRNQTQDSVSPDVGFEFDRIIGERVEKGETIATVYASGDEGLAAGLALAESAISIVPEPPARRSLVIEEISGR